uniref:Uncharacterized protein n=1 Tax=Cacopsylla melanoneura TaxID=428564 RepID=A0A8D8Z6C8_9HEMI
MPNVLRSTFMKLKFLLEKKCSSFREAPELDVLGLSLCLGIDCLLLFLFLVKKKLISKAGWSGTSFTIGSPLCTLTTKLLFTLGLLYFLNNTKSKILSESFRTVLCDSRLKKLQVLLKTSSRVKVMVSSSITWGLLKACRLKSPTINRFFSYATVLCCKRWL